MVKKVFRGDRLKDVRERRGLSQADLGQIADMSNMQVYRYENRKSEPSPDIVVRLSRALDITSDYLLGMVDKPEGYLNPQDLSPTEARLLAAYRRGDLRDAMDVLARNTSS